MSLFRLGSPAAAALALFFPILTVGGYLSEAAPAQQEVEEPEERIRVDVNLVTLRFSVRDSGGGPLNTLQKDDFRIYELGARKEIAFFEPPRNVGGGTPYLRLAFLLDVSGSTLSTRTEEILAARAFLDSVTEATEVGVFGFTDELMVFQDFTSNRSAALGAFAAAKGHLGPTAIYDSVNALIQRMTRGGGGRTRKAIILISDGIDGDFARASQSVALARLNNVVLYTILIPSSSQLYEGPALEHLRRLRVDPTIPNQEEKLETFERLSRDTGGRHFSGLEAILDFEQALARINEDLFGNLYTVGYYTDDPTREKLDRNIQVTTTAPGAVVSEPFKDVPERMRTKMRFVAALFDNEALAAFPDTAALQFREIGAEMDILTPRSEGGGGLPFRIKISPFSLRAGERDGVQTQLGVIGMLVDEDGNEVVRLREFFRVNLGARDIREGRGIIYSNKLLAPPGRYRFRLALLEVDTWRLTSFESPVRIDR